VSAYEIHHGRIAVLAGDPLFSLPDGTTEGCRNGAVFGTVWHGVLENDAYRRELLSWVAQSVGKRWLPGDVAFAAVRESRLESLADRVADHLDREAVLRLIEHGAPADLPFVPPGMPE
jgi:adenosylcobyric acid synthase